MTTNADIAIRVDQVRKVYKLYRKHADRVKEAFHPFGKVYHRPFTALDGISFSVKKGETVGIIGRNGSGKSTLLQIICGILQANAGEVQVKGRISALLELGAGFNPEFTGVENIYLNSTILGSSREETDRKYDAIVAFAGIGDFIHQPVKTYSSGMYIRLAFAIAVHVDPEILVIDEALAVGDIYFQQKCIQHMQNYMQGCTKVLVSHDMHAVANMCERVIVLDEGRIIFEGSPIKGIEYYTKLSHNELFEKPPNGPVAKEEIQRKNTDPDDSVIDEIRTGWIEVPEDATGGAREVVIQKIRISALDGEPVEVLKAQDPLLLHFLVHCTVPKENIIFGYTVKDRVGNAIFGENTCNDSTGTVALHPGLHHVTLRIEWPEVYPDKYTLTFGIGEGTHPFRHTIQCWAHNIVSVSSISPDRCIHATFNNPILELGVRTLR